MKRAPREWRAHTLSILLATVPFAFALIRAARTGYDLRYLWVAVAALLGAMAFMAAGKASSRRPRVVVALSAGAGVMATLLAVLVALLLGTTAGPGMLVVASGFGFCFAASCLLRTLARPRATGIGAGR